MVAYVVLLAILVAWASIVLPNAQSLRVYAVIYGVNTVIAVITEAVFAIVLDRYSFGNYTNYFLVTVGIEPLMGVLYAHYSRRWPILRAVLAAIILGGPLERLFLRLGAFRYDRGWHPLLTVTCFAGYFIWTWWLRGFVSRHTESTLQTRRPV